MEWPILLVFVVGYVAITMENRLHLNKAASALLTGVLCWTVYILQAPEHHVVSHAVTEQMGEIAGILFFLLGAMVIVELIDAHDGFEVIIERIRTTGRRRLLWTIALLAFFLSAVLDNLTTTIVMISLLRKLVQDREDRMLLAGIVVVAANAGGAWSPIGDVTTTMLWIGGQITPLNIVRSLFMPSLVCLLVPLLILGQRLKGKVSADPKDSGDKPALTKPGERNLVFGLGLGSLLFVPVFKSLTHLPPFMGMLFCLGVLWVATEMIHSGKDEMDRGPRSVNHALRKIDTPSILFFLGILLAIGALQQAGILTHLAVWLDRTIGNLAVTGILIGLLSAVVDNVPLVAATQGMYSLEAYPADHFLWELLAYTTGTGGSILIIGSAAGVAAMGMEKIDFFWYIKRVSLWALIGYLAGAAAYIVQYNLTH